MNKLELGTYVRLSLTLVFHTVRSKVEVADTRSSEILGQRKK